jgi:hypothetical protein
MATGNDFNSNRTIKVTFQIKVVWNVTIIFLFNKDVWNDTRKGVSIPMVNMFWGYWSLRSKLEVLVWCHIVYVPKSSTTFLICVILDPVICKNNICHSGSSQVIQVYIPRLFYISPERISNTRYLFCVLHHWASFTRECHGTATLQTQTTSTYDVIGHR